MRMIPHAPRLMSASSVEPVKGFAAVAACAQLGSCRPDNESSIIRPSLPLPGHGESSLGKAFV